MDRYVNATAKKGWIVWPNTYYKRVNALAKCLLLLKNDHLNKPVHLMQGKA